MVSPVLMEAMRAAIKNRPPVVQPESDPYDSAQSKAPFLRLNWQDGIDNATKQFEPPANYGAEIRGPSTFDLFSNPQKAESGVPGSAYEMFLSQAESVNPQLELRREKQKNIRDGMMNLLQRRGALQPQLVEPKRVDYQEGIWAGAIAALARLAGARDQYVQPALSNYLAGRQGRLNQDAAQQQLEADAAYQAEVSKINAELQAAGLEYDAATGEIRQLEADQANLYKLAGNAYQQDQQTLRTMETQAGLDRRANIRAELDWFKANNPAKFVELTQEYNMRLNMLGEESAKEWLGIEVQKARDESAKAQAQTNLDRAKAKTEDATRQGKVDILMAELERTKGLIEKDRKEIELKIRKHAASLVTDEDEAAYKRAIGILDADIGTLELDIEMYDTELPIYETELESLAEKFASSAVGGVPDPSVVERMKEVSAQISRIKNAKIDAKKRINELKRKQIDQKKTQVAAPSSGRNPSTTSRGGSSSELHTQFRKQLANKFPGMRLEQWSEPRKMRGAGGTGMSRHGDGRAIDAFYRSAKEKQELIDYAIKSGAKLIIDYNGKRNWRPGKGWYSAPANNPSYKHLQIELD